MSTDEAPYTKREEDQWRESVSSVLNEILGQTKKTNGRVTKLEVWRGILLGGGAVVTAIVIPLVVYIFNSKINDLSSGVASIQNITIKK